MYEPSEDSLQQAGRNVMTSAGPMWWAGFSLLLAFAVFLFFFRLGAQDFWTDEVLSQVKFDSLTENLKQIATDVHPPLYFVASWGWNALWGSSTEAGYRSLSALIGVCCVVLTVVLAGRIVHRNFGLLAGLVIAMSPYFLQYSRMHRYYSLMVFWTLLALVFLWSPGRKNWWWGVRCGLANLGLMCTNYVGAIFIMGQAAMVPFIYPRERRIWGKWLLGQGIMVLGILPWLWVMARQAIRGNIAYQIEKAPLPFLGQAVDRLQSALLKVAYSAYVFTIGETTFPWKWLITIPGCVVVVVGIVMLLRIHGNPGRNSRYLLGLAAGAVIATVVLTEVYTRVFSFQSFALLPSRLLPVVPILLVAITYGLYSIRVRIARIALIAILLACQTYGVWHYFARDQFLNPKYNVPWRQALALVIDRTKGASFACTDESSYLYYNRLLGGPPAYGVMDLWQGFQEVADPEHPLSLWVISRYRGDPGIRLAYRELQEFCHRAFSVTLDTTLAPIDEELKRFLGKVIGEPAPDHILSVVQYEVPMTTLGLEGIEDAMRDYMNEAPERKRILGWIKEGTNF
jgi:uncharacterized membrane protein